MSKSIQKIIDDTAKARAYWKQLANAIGTGEGSAIVTGLTARIQAAMDQYSADMRNADPSNAPAVAKAQEGYRALSLILLDFDMDVCHKNITELNNKMKSLNAELEKAKDKKRRQTSGHGYTHLIAEK